MYGIAVGVIGISPSDFWRMTMWEWWAAFYHKALSLGSEFEKKLDHQGAKEIMKNNMQW